MRIPRLESMMPEHDLTPVKPLSLSEVAALVDGEVRGDADITVSAVVGIDEAQAGALAFLAHPRYAAHVDTTRASAILVASALAHVVPEGMPAVVVSDAHRALQRIAVHFSGARVHEPGIHPTAVLGHGVSVGEGVSIGPYAVLEDGARVGDRTRIGAHAVLGRGAVVGHGCNLYPHVVLYPETEIGDRVVVHSGARIGSDGFGYVLVDGVHEKIPHSGGCTIGNDVEIGANSTIDRGSIGHTRIEDGSKLDNLVHIAHNVRIGAGSLLAALVGIAGSTKVGKGVWMGGQSGAVNQVEIGDGARVIVQTGITRDVEPGETVSGFPARPHREELRLRALLGRLPGLRRRVRDLEGRSDAGGTE